MENKEESPWNSFRKAEEELADDVLSFRNFSMLDNNHDGTGSVHSARISFDFEFIIPETQIIFTNPDYLNSVQPDPFLGNGNYSSLNGDRSDSLSFLRSPKNYSCNKVQKVNITALTTMSAKSRRRMFMFGPVKFKPEMELSAIKERQNRRVPTVVKFPTTARVAEAGETVAVGGGGRKRRQWKIMRALRSRAHFSNVLAKSCACLPLSSRLLPGN